MVVMVMVVMVSIDEPILSFQRNAFYHLRDERRLLKHQDPASPNNYCLAIDLLYHEVKDHQTHKDHMLEQGVNKLVVCGVVSWYGATQM